MNCDFKNASVVKITPNDTTVLSIPCVAFFVNDTGDIKIETETGDITIIRDCQAGEEFPVSVVRFYATDTTATQIYAYFYKGNTLS